MLVHGILGVRFIYSVFLLPFSNIPLQDEQIYFTDPLALHHIVLKDQQSFIEPESHMALVYFCSLSIDLRLIKDILHRTNGAILGEGLLATVGESSADLLLHLSDN